MLPTPEAFSSAVRELGIGDGQTIVVYDGAGLYASARVWWTFRVFGAREVFILDGGFPKWKAEGRPIDFGEVKRLPRHFTARMDHARGRRRRPTCAGARERHAPRWSTRARPNGSADRRRSRGRDLRSGRMPGSFNVPFQVLVEDGRLAPPEQLAAAFARGRRRHRQADRHDLRLGRHRRHPHVRARRARQGAGAAVRRLVVGMGRAHRTCRWRPDDAGANFIVDRRRDAKNDLYRVTRTA